MMRKNSCDSILFKLQNEKFHSSKSLSEINDVQTNKKTMCDKFVCNKKLLSLSSTKKMMKKSSNCVLCFKK